MVQQGLDILPYLIPANLCLPVEMLMSLILILSLSVSKCELKCILGIVVVTSEYLVFLFICEGSVYVYYDQDGVVVVVGHVCSSIFTALMTYPLSC